MDLRIRGALLALCRRSAIDGQQLKIELGGRRLLVTVARSPRAVAKGLGGAPPLDDDHGMLFLHGSRREQAYWMRGLTFALDIVWIEGDHVVAITPEVPPPGPGTGEQALPVYRSGFPVDKVIEVRGGWTSAYGVGRGAILRMDPALRLAGGGKGR